MNRTGHYEYVPSQGWVKVSEDIPTLKPSVYVPKGDIPHYDSSLRMRIESKAHKRHVLQESHLKEGGLITTDKRWDDHSRNRSKPSWQARQAATQRQAWIQSQGGTEGLLKRVSQGA